jgi:hypothetical protein
VTAERSGAWRTRIVVAGVIGSAAYVAIIVGADLVAAEIASHDPPMTDMIMFSFAPSAPWVLLLEVSSVLLGTFAVVAVQEAAGCDTIRTPPGIVRAVFALGLALCLMPVVVGLLLFGELPDGLAYRLTQALVLAGPPLVVTLAYLTGPPPRPLGAGG